MDAVLDLLISKVAQTVEDNATLILGIKDQVEDLLSELRSFRAYLTEAAKNNNGNDNAVVGDVVHKIRGVVNDAEDAIDRYLADRKIHRSKGVFKRWAEKAAYYTKVNLAAREIESIKNRAQKIRQDHARCLEKIQDGHQTNAQPALLQAPVVEEDGVVGFDTEAQTIKDRLNEKSDDTIVISIVGMSGLGKTTLTNMVFNDRELHYECFTRFWIYVSRTMNRRQIFMDIISRFTKDTERFKNMSEELLAERIKEYLKDGKYFIVVDDVWYKKDWDHLKIAFPDNKKGSRVLVTTRDGGVANHVDSKSAPHKLNFLSDEESWELLQKKVFRKENCPDHLVSTGRSIGNKCNGLPLAVVVIAGALDKSSTARQWKEVAEDPFPVINREKQSYNELVKLSYDQLPSHTKDCFLYLAALPIGHEIPVWKLIRLWIAEGFIPSSPNMEGEAEAYLKDIVNRNLLMVVKKRADGEIKTCRLHDQLHEFCKSEAAKNYLFHEIDGSMIEPNANYRRLCIRSNLKSFIESENMPSGEHIRSLLTSTEQDIPKEHLATIPKSYPLLKVFDAEALKFEILAKEFYQLYHLRYLAVSTDSKLIPTLFSDLWNLQTLVFNTSQTRIEVKADIWKLTRLRHILANASLELPQPSESSKESSSCLDLQTVSTISPKSCTEEIFDKMPNLLKLGVRGDLAELVESKEGICLFDNIQKLDKLVNLKLMQEAFNDQIRSFPRADKFPRKLRKLTLSKTCFDWKDICVLGSLGELEVLKLDEFSAKGESWELNNNVVFKSLKFLRIGRTDLVYWTLDEYSFPVLKWLYISQCEHLNQVPLAFKDVRSLKVMDLFYTNKHAANSAREIRDKKPRKDRFELSIFPPNH